MDLLFAAAPNHVLEVDDHTVNGGETFTVSKERGEELIAEIPEVVEDRDLAKATKAELAEIAESRGIESEGLNKSDLVSALETPVADGEGHPDNPESTEV